MAKSKYSKEDWAIALKDGLFKRINSIRKDLVGQLIQGIENPITVDGKTGEAFTPQDLIWRSNHSDESIDLALKILNSRNKKIQYYKRKINEAFSKGHKVYHLTLPFYENEENKLSLLEKHIDNRDHWSGRRKRWNPLPSHCFGANKQEAMDLLIVCWT
jgi:hypothetical protein